jgi:tRNA A-37 threonylcarbamoyl transferase component Bud32
MAEITEIQTGGVRWSVRQVPGAQDGCLLASLFGPDGLRLAEWLASGQAQMIKTGPHRRIYRVRLPDIDFYLKHYPLSDRAAWLRALVRPSKARTEFEHALTMAARHVPTVEALAVGEQGSGGPSASYLMTRTLADAQSLDVYLRTVLPKLERSEQARMRQRLAVSLGRFLTRVHEAGITQRDLHPGNLLLRLEGGEPQLYLIDLHAVDVGPPLGWRASRANLVILNRWFMLRSHRSDRMRFWRAYAQARATGSAPCCPAADSRLAVRDLEVRTFFSNLRFWRQRDRRCRRTNRAFRRLSHESLVGHAVTDLSSEALTPLLADPDAPFQSPDVIVLKHSPTSAVVEMDLPGADGPRRVIYKRFSVTKWSDPLTALVRPTPALRSYVLGHGLQLRLLPTPRPLAVWHRHRFGLPREGYLLTEKVEEALDLHGALARLQGRPPADARPRLRRLIEKVARLIGTLHQRFLTHRDLKAANVLVSHLLSESPCLWLIDLVGVRRHRKLPRKRRVQNLARLHASFLGRPELTRTDKLRFLRVYLRWGLRGRLGWKRWWRQVERATAVKVRRNQRNGRPLG